MHKVVVLNLTGLEDLSGLVVVRVLNLTGLEDLSGLVVVIAILYMTYPQFRIV